MPMWRMRRRQFSRRFNKPLYRRRYGKPRRTYARSLNSQNKIYSIKRTAILTPFTINEAGAIVPQPAGSFVSNSTGAGFYRYGFLKFKLTDLPNHTDFTNLYERYKIKGVSLKFVPVHGTGNESQMNLGNMSPVAVSIQRSSKVSASDILDFDNILEQQDSRVYTSQKPFKIYIPWPKFAAPASANVQAQEKGGWLVSKHPDVDHWGLNYAFEQTSLYATSFKVYATYYIKLANPS